MSPHGYGHAARASAVMAEAHRRARAEFDVFSTVPAWFFDECIAGFYRYHPLACDVGFRQRSALVVDLDGTVEALHELLPFDDGLLDELAATVLEAGCRAVLCDIAPMGVAVAERAGLPSLLVESFSWPWLYEPFHRAAPDLAELGERLDVWSARATVHVQTEPLCRRDDRLELLDPISREPRRSRAEARAELGLGGDETVVVLTTGGYAQDFPFLDRLRELRDVTFLITGMRGTRVEGNLRMFDRATPIFMPDFLRAADALVAKLGYGTVAETWREGIPAAFVSRQDFREMPPLERYVTRHCPGFVVAGEDFAAGEWIERVPELLATPRGPGRERGGATRAAEVLLGLA